jgi:adenine-specific DNA-methyltransferase
MADIRHRRHRDIARSLRREGSDSEYLLWYHLRGRKRAGHKFRRQQPLGPFVVDFVCFARKLVIELDGPQHEDAAHKRYDLRRTDWLEQQGFTVLRFWNIEVYDDRQRVLRVIDEHLLRLKPHGTGPASR